MTKNRRYEAHYDKLSEQRIEQAVFRGEATTTLPQGTYGPQPIEWAEGSPPVWAWITWREGPATRIPAVTTGWDDRLVIIEWEAPGGRRSNVVWRNAVTRRGNDETLPPTKR